MAVTLKPAVGTWQVKGDGGAIALQHSEAPFCLHPVAPNIRGPICEQNPVHFERYLLKHLQQMRPYLKTVYTWMERRSPRRRCKLYAKHKETKSSSLDLSGLVFLKTKSKIQKVIFSAATVT
ncbi:unnamed protein product [Caretta caretta]